MADNNKVIVELLLANNQYLAQLSASRKKTEEFAQKSQKSIGGALSVMKTGFAAVIASQAVEYIREFANEAAKYDTIKRAYENLTASYGANSKKLVESMREASMGTLSQRDAMEASSNAIQLMGEGVIDMLPRMAEIAKSAARASGVEVSQMMNDIVKASGRQSVMILDNLGISSVTAGQKQEEFARKLGKTRDQLTASEKASAFFYAITEAGGEIVSRAGDKTLTLGEKMQVLNSNARNLKDVFINELNPGLSELAGKFIDMSDSGGMLETAMRNLGRELSAEMIEISGWGAELELFYWKLQKLLKTSITGEVSEEYKEISKRVEEAAKAYAVYTEKAEKARKGELESIKQANKQQRRGAASSSSSGSASKLSPSSDLLFSGFATLKEDAKAASKSILSDFSKLAQEWGNNISSLFDSVADNALVALDTKKTQIGMLFDYMEQRALQSYGIQEKTASQHAAAELRDLQKQYVKTTNIAQKKALREQMIEKRKEKTKADIEEKSAKRKQALDLMVDLFSMQLQRKQFERNKAYQISMVWINTAAAIAAAWLAAWQIQSSGGVWAAAVALGAVSTALMLANAAVQTALISGAKAPAYETGSWDVQTTGPAVLHGGEIVTPKPIADSIRSGDAYLGAGSAGGDIVMIMDGRQVGRVVRDRNSRFARNIGGRSFSMAGAY